jgi:hypothetical protein
MRFGFVAALVLVSAGPAFAGYYMEHEAIMPNPVTLKPVKATIHSWQEGRRYKRDNPLRGEVVIIDVDKNEVYGINAGKKTFWKISSDKYRQLTLLSLVVMGIQVKPDGGIVVPEPLFVRTGQTATVEGRKAYEVKVQGALPPGMSTSLWLSKDVPLPMESLIQQLRLALGDPKTADFEQLFGQWGQLEGYPVQTVTTIQTPQGLITSSETLLTFQEKKIPKSEFEVPKGYALVVDPITELEQMQQRQMGPAAGIGAPLPQSPPPPPAPAPKK